MNKNHIPFSVPPVSRKNIVTKAFNEKDDHMVSADEKASLMERSGNIMQSDALNQILDFSSEDENEVEIKR